MNERGFALLSLMIVISASSMLFIAAIQRFDAPWSSAAEDTESNLAIIREAAERAYWGNRTFPTSLDDLQTAAGLPTDGPWRIDPHGASEELDYAVSGSPSTVTVRSRGVDGQLGTGDDVTMTVSSQGVGRMLTWNRMRILRAAFLRSAYMYSGAMTAGDAQAMRDAVRTWSNSQRGILHAANTTVRANLVSQRDTARTTILNLRTTYGLSAPPASMTGPGSLLSNLSLPDSLGTDGFGRALLVSDAVGFTSQGGDGTGGTDDDL